MRTHYRRPVLGTALAAGLIALGGPVQAQGQGDIDAGVVFGQGSTLAGAERYSGATGRFWLSSNQAIQAGLRFTSAGNENVGLFGEFQQHFYPTTNSDSSVFVGGGLGYQQLDSDFFDDDLVYLYAPIGFQFPMESQPVTFTVSSSATFFIDPDTEVEFFDEVRVGVLYNF